MVELTAAANKSTLISGPDNCGRLDRAMFVLRYYCDLGTRCQTSRARLHPLSGRPCKHVAGRPVFRSTGNARRTSELDLRQLRPPPSFVPDGEHEFRPLDTRRP